MQLCRPPVRYRLRQTHVAALFTSSERFRKLSGMAGLPRCNEAANIHGKETRSAYGMLMPSIRIFGEDRLDAAAPGAVKLFQELFGRRDTARDVSLDRTQIAPLVSPPPASNRRRRASPFCASAIVVLARCSTSCPATLAAKPSFGTSSRNFWRSSAVQFLTRSQAASRASSS